MKAKNLPTAAYIIHSLALALGLMCRVSLASSTSITIDFEGVPSTYNYDGDGMNLGGYYAGLPGGPTFGPQATVLEVGGSLNDALYPPASGIAVLFGEDPNIELDFTSNAASSVGLYYRSSAELFLFAYDAGGNLLGSVSGPDDLGPGAGQNLLFNAGGNQIAQVLISGPGGFYVVDDLNYVTSVPDPISTGPALAAGLGVVLALARARPHHRVLGFQNRL